MQRWIWNLQQPQIQLSSNWFINVILGYPFLYIAKKNILCKSLLYLRVKAQQYFVRLSYMLLARKLRLNFRSILG